MSALLLLMPWVSEISGTTRGWSVRIAGMCFWMLAVAGYGAVYMANQSRRRFLRKKFHRDIQKNLPCGLFGIAVNPMAKIMDGILLADTLLLGIQMLIPYSNSVILIALLTVWLWAMNMHCLFNGKIYRMTKYDMKERKRL